MAPDASQEAEKHILVKTSVAGTPPRTGTHSEKGDLRPGAFEKKATGGADMTNLTRVSETVALVI
jgi:hypothetical protein